MMDLWLKSSDESKINDLRWSAESVIGPKEYNGEYYIGLRNPYNNNLPVGVERISKSEAQGHWLDKPLISTFIGINISSLAFGCENTDYLAENNDECIQSFIDVGVRFFRIPVKWEYLQPELDGPLDWDVVRKLRKHVDYCLTRGARVMIDTHSFGKYNGLKIGEDLTVEQYLYFKRLLAREFSGDDVWFDTMNEPYVMSIDEWKNISQQEINVIREEGFKGEIIIEGGGSFSAAHLFVSGGWGDRALTLTDPLNKLIFSPHCYFDSDCSGTHTTVAYRGVGIDRIKDVTQWAEQNNKKLILGEFGVANNEDMLNEGRDTLQYMKDHPVWVSACYWASGSGWGNYAYLVSADNEQGLMLREFL